jgi:hypothetical protein
MSKGPGRIERAIQAIFNKEPDNALTIDELVLRIYSCDRQIERKQSVAVRRAVHNIRKHGSSVGAFATEARGGRLIVYNRFSLMSYALACMRCGARAYSPKEELLEEVAEGGRFHHHVVEGGRWWLQTQWAIEEHAAKQAGDEERLKRLKAEQDRQYAEWREGRAERPMQALNRDQDD